MPAVRVHTMVAVQVAPSIDMFVRMEASSLVLDGNDVGIRSENHCPWMTDTTWAQL